MVIGIKKDIQRNADLDGKKQQTARTDSMAVNDEVGQI